MDTQCKAVADNLEEAGDRLFTFTRLPVSQWTHFSSRRECCSLARRRKLITGAGMKNSL
jgi:hypothetical protein